MEKETVQVASGVRFAAPMLNTKRYKYKQIDIAYDDKSKNQKFDLYYPDESSRNLPAVFYVHGGAFEMGNKQSGYIFTMIKGLKMGYAIGSINYRLSYEQAFPAAVDDVRNAIRYIRLHAEELRIDPERIAVIGESAGGNLTAMLAANPDDAFFDTEVPEKLQGVSCHVKCAADLFGPLDFSVMYDQLKENGFKEPPFSLDESPEARYLGTKTLLEDKELLKKSNPIHFVSEKTAPLFIMHGTKDHNVPVQQSEALYKKLLEYKVPCEFVPVEKAAHMSLKFVKKTNISKVWNFFDTYLKSNGEGER